MFRRSPTGDAIIAALKFLSAIKNQKFSVKKISRGFQQISTNLDKSKSR